MRFIHLPRIAGPSSCMHWGGGGEEISAPGPGLSDVRRGLWSASVILAVWGGGIVP